jgi:hypothetical protein
MQVFERILSLGSLECQEAPLLCQKVSLPIFSGRIGLIFAKTIVSTAYSKSWTLIVFVITFNLLLDLHPFLLKAIGWQFKFTPLLGALEVLLENLFS